MQEVDVRSKIIKYRQRAESTDTHTVTHTQSHTQPSHTSRWSWAVMEREYLFMNLSEEPDISLKSWLMQKNNLKGK